MDNKYENSGNLFPANNTEIVRQGKVDIEGLDHELVIAKTITPKKGMTIFEVYKQVGVLYINDDKTEIIISALHELKNKIKNKK